MSVGGGGRSSGRGSGGSAFFRRETLAEPDDVGYYDDDDFIVGSDEEREAEERDAELRRQVMILLSIPNPPLVYILSFHYGPSNDRFSQPFHLKLLQQPIASIGERTQTSSQRKKKDTAGEGAATARVIGARTEGSSIHGDQTETTQSDCR